MRELDNRCRFFGVIKRGRGESEDVVDLIVHEKCFRGYKLIHDVGFVVMS